MIRNIFVVLVDTCVMQYYLVSVKHVTLNTCIYVCICKITFALCLNNCPFHCFERIYCTKVILRNIFILRNKEDLLVSGGLT